MMNWDFKILEDIITSLIVMHSISGSYVSYNLLGIFLWGVWY